MIADGPATTSHCRAVSSTIGADGLRRHVRADGIRSDSRRIQSQVVDPDIPTVVACIRVVALNAADHGTHLVAASNDLVAGGTNVWIMNDDGTGALALGIPTDQSFDPSWAPDGKRVLSTASAVKRKRASTS